MENFNLYTKETVADLISRRNGETKLGEVLHFVETFEALENTKAKFVIFGIPEDIGVRANYGKPGTATAWSAFLSAFLNIQQNRFNTADNCVLLGEIDCEKWMKEAGSIASNELDYHKKMGGLVSEIDDTVSKIVSRIVSAGKIPIIIGGGHNNAYGNIKGTSAALKKPINVLNIDAHTDLRKTEHRHSGNGFRYALQEGFLEKYAVFGLHQNYTPEHIFEFMKSSKNLHFQLFEELLPFSTAEKMNELQKSCAFLDKRFGLEIDCDAIANFDSSAKSPSGFSLNEIRFFVRELRKHYPLYLHICEASANKNPMIGKSLAYLVGDFLNA